MSDLTTKILTVRDSIADFAESDEAPIDEQLLAWTSTLTDISEAVVYLEAHHTAKSFDNMVELLAVADESMSLSEIVADLAREHEQTPPSRPEEFLAYVEEIIAQRIHAYQWQIDPFIFREVDTHSVEELMYWAGAIRDLGILPSPLPWNTRRIVGDMREQFPIFAARSDRDSDQFALSNFITWLAGEDVHIVRLRNHLPTTELAQLLSAYALDAWGSEATETETTTFKKLWNEFVGFLFMKGYCFTKGVDYDEYEAGEAIFNFFGFTGDQFRYDQDHFMAYAKNELRRGQ